MKANNLFKISEFNVNMLVGDSIIWEQMNLETLTNVISKVNESRRLVIVNVGWMI